MSTEDQKTSTAQPNESEQPSDAPPAAAEQDPPEQQADSPRQQSAAPTIATSANEADAVPVVPVLNRDARHSSIRGSKNNIGFLQNGHYFTNQGEYSHSVEGAAEPKKPVAPPPPPKSPRGGVAAANASSAQQGGINLQAWYDEKEQHRWHKIAAAVKAATGEQPKNKVHGIELLKQHGVISDGNELYDAGG